MSNRILLALMEQGLFDMVSQPGGVMGYPEIQFTRKELAQAVLDRKRLTKRYGELGSFLRGSILSKQEFLKALLEGSNEPDHA